MSAKPSFDYIVIGAGSAGCVLANRLSENPSASVLLIEAGPRDVKPEIHDPQGFVPLMNSDVDWAYKSLPEPALNNRRILLNRGKTLGGTSATNAMIFIRGHRLDFDHWNYLGNEGWNYEGVLPYFKRSEDNEPGPNCFRGIGGPVSVRNYTSYTQPSPAATAFVHAALEFGMRGGPDWDFNIDAAEESTGYYQFNITRDGKRCSTATAYLNPILGRPNLTIWTDTQVSRVVVENGRATAVEVARDGRLEQVGCSGEIILSAGAFDSPKILLNSGIGPAETLRQHGIPIAVDLPGVGQNLQDHLLMPIVFKCTSPQPIPRCLAEAGLLTRTRPGLPTAAPDLQINFNASIPALLPADCPTKGPSFTFITILVRPQSIGYVTIAGRDPLAAPVVQENYLQCEADMQVQLKAIELCRELASQQAFAGLNDGEALPGKGKTESELREYVRSHASTIWHPVGTCKMGRDRAAVVDPRLRVYGIDGLRVADASIMPTIVSANPNAAIIMIGEKASDLIMEDNSRRTAPAKSWREPVGIASDALLSVPVLAS